MHIIPADPERQIELPDLGLRPCPVSVDGAGLGLTRLVALRLFRLADGETARGDGAVTLRVISGEAEGPGDGGSGAKVTHGTDIWYSWISSANFTGGGAWSAISTSSRYCEK